ncbi:MAG: hypothetical protein Q9160_003892 [Pyrenula sp. 1 TL-2023]
MILSNFNTNLSPSSSSGHWLPTNRVLLKEWLATKLERLNSEPIATLDPSIVQLQVYVAANPYLNKLSQEMFTQIPPAYSHDPSGKPQVRDFETMLKLLDMILKEGPHWLNSNHIKTAMGVLGCPINAILDWPMGTLAGYMFFLDAGVNSKLQHVLCTWGEFLSGPQSMLCLDQENGWLCANALNTLAAKVNYAGKTNYSFQEIYECDPMQPGFGFTSWDDFFTRRFKPGIRPIAYPDDEPKPADQRHPTQVIVNACESTPLRFSAKVKFHDTFWLKHQPYSLANMMNNDPLTSQFVDGSVYQAFLSALSYHRWHAPVCGKVVRICIIPGSYYSENLYQGFTHDVDSNDEPDSNAPNNSQPYISAVATRGIIFMQSDNPVIGLMAIVFIGMAEVSSCEFVVKEGDHLTKGDLMGMFHYGGSSYCMVFRPETKLSAECFVKPLPEQMDHAADNAVCSALAVVEPPPPAEAPQENKQPGLATNFRDWMTLSLKFR